MVEACTENRHAQPYIFADHSRAASHLLWMQKQTKLSNLPLLFLILPLEHGDLTEKVIRKGKVSWAVTSPRFVWLSVLSVYTAGKKVRVSKEYTLKAKIVVSGHRDATVMLKESPNLKNGPKSSLGPIWMMQAFASNEAFDAAVHLHGTRVLSPLKLQTFENGLQSVLSWKFHLLFSCVNWQRGESENAVASWHTSPMRIPVK